MVGGCTEMSSAHYYYKEVIKMSKIDLNTKQEEVKTQTSNSTETEKLANVEPAKTQTQSAELTDNTSAKSENTQKTDKQTNKAEQKTEDKKGTVVVTYIGSGVWKDESGELWASTIPASAGSIINERQYSASEYDSREDIKFMVGYGAMKATFVK